MAYKDPARTVLYNKNRYLRLKDDPAYKEKKRAWYLKNAQKISEQKKAERALKPKRALKTEEEIRERNRKWRQENKVHLREKSRTRRQQNLPRYQLYARNYYVENLSLKVQFQRLGATARERGYSVELTFEQFSSIVSKPCAYCGESKFRVGIDRIQNELGYTLSNSAPCCKICNYMKRTFSVQEFLDHINKIATWQKEPNNRISPRSL